MNIINSKTAGDICEQSTEFSPVCLALAAMKRALIIFWYKLRPLNTGYLQSMEQNRMVMKAIIPSTVIDRKNVPKLVNRWLNFNSFGFLNMISSSLFFTKHLINQIAPLTNRGKSVLPARINTTINNKRPEFLANIAMFSFVAIKPPFAKEETVVEIANRPKLIPFPAKISLELEIIDTYNRQATKPVT